MKLSKKDIRVFLNSKNQNLLLTDTYPQSKNHFKQDLILYDVSNNLLETSEVTNVPFFADGGYGYYSFAGADTTTIISYIKLVILFN